MDTRQEDAVDAPVGVGFVQTPPQVEVPTAEPPDREIWSHDEARMLNRAGQFAKRRGCSLILLCDDVRCQPDPLLRRVDVSENVFELRCAHKTRVVRRRV